MKVDLYITNVTAVGTTCKIWAQDDTDKCQDIENLLETVDGDGEAKPVKNEKTVTPGSLLLGKYHEDMRWYRAKVVEVPSSKSSVKVQFIDFGNVEELAFQDLRFGGSKYFCHPPQGKQYVVTDICPKKDCWSDEETDILKDQLLYAELSGELLGSVLPGAPTPIRLFDGLGTTNPIVPQLVEKGAGLGEKLELPKCSVNMSALEVGSKHHIYVSYVDSALSFWIQKGSSASHLDILHETIDADVSKIPLKVFMPGAYCLALFSETETFYRAVILDALPDNQSSVLFIDYGNTEIVSNSNIANLSDAYSQLPIQGIPCALEEPIDITVLNTYPELETVYAQIVSVTKDGIHIVRLFDSEEKCPMTSDSDVISRSQQISKSDNAAVNQVISVSPVLFDVGKYIDLTIAAVEKTGHFYCQLNQNAIALDQLMYEIQSSYKSQQNMSKPTEDQFCIVLTDNIFYRAQVVAVNKDQIKVRHIDFGSQDTTSLSNLYDILPSHASLPMQAIYCSLSGSEKYPVGEVYDLLCKYDSKVPLVGKVSIKTPTFYDLELYDTRNGDIRLCDMLKKDVISPTSMSQNTMLDTAIPAPSIESQKNEKVYVTAITSPVEFFAQLSKYSADTLDNMQQELGAFYEKQMGQLKPLDNIKNQTLCATTFSEDGGWYRAKVTSISEETAGVQYIDYGNGETKSLAELFPLHKDFCKLPQQGVWCTLDNLISPGKELLEEVLLEKEIVIYATSILSECKVHASLPKVPENEDILTKLEFLPAVGGMASPVTSQNSPRSIPTDSKNARTIISQPVSQFIKPFVKVGQWEEVIITFAENPDNFFCQLISSEGELNTLMSQIDVHCNKFQIQLDNVNIGSPCLAKYSEDGGWYRAVINGVTSDGKYEVTFVDYGNGEAIDRSELKPISPEFMELPMQAIQCQLAGLTTGKTWSQDEIDVFTDLTMDKNQVILIQSQNKDSFVVEMWDDNTCINQMYGEQTRSLKNLQLQGPPPSTWNSHQAPGSVDTARKMAAATSLGSPSKERFGAGDSPKKAFSSPKADSFVRRDSQERKDALDFQGNKSRERIQDVSINKIDKRFEGQDKKSEKTEKKKWAKWEDSGRSKVEFTYEDFAPNKYIDVFVCYAFNPGKFWCQKVAATAQLETLMANLNADYARMKKMECLVSGPTVGQPCCAMFSEDGCWYRAKVVEVEGKTATVQFVDYGNSELMEISMLKELKPQYLANPAMAFECCLDNLEPLEEKWSAEAVSEFEKLVSEKNLVGCIIEKHGENTYSIELLDTRQGQQVSIHDALVQKRVAKSQNPIEMLQMKPSRGTHSRRTSGSSTSSRGSVKIQPAVRDIQELTIQEGAFIDVNVVFVCNPSQFWCQMTEQSAQIDALMTEMGQHYGNLSNAELRMVNPQVGQVCCAKFSEDEEWYRGKIMKVERSQIKVKFVDYGNSEWLSKDSVKNLSVKFLQLPAQAVQMTLNDLRPAIGDLWLDESVHYFDDITRDKNLIAEIKGKSCVGSYCVELIEATKGNKKEVGVSQQLVDIGVAVQGALSLSALQGKCASPTKGKKTQQDSKIESYKEVSIATGERYEVCVSWVNNPKEFWCYLSQNDDDLQKLMDSMFEYYQSLKMSDLTLDNPQPEQPCVALYEADGGWYRGIIKDKKEGEVNVYYVDFGNTNLVRMSKVKQIKQEYMALPAQAIKCSLRGVEPPCGRWQRKAIEAFNLLVKLTSVKCKFVTEMPDVMIVDLEDEKGQDLSARLIESGTVRPAGRPSNVVSRESAAVPPPQPSPVQQEREEITYTYENASLREGQNLKVMVSHIESPLEFYCHKLETSNSLDIMMNKLESHYAALDEVCEALDELKVGLCCVAKFSEDDAWYRSVITKVEDENNAHVTFVDYGNNETVPRRKMKKLGADFRNLPAQAIHCTLSDIADTGNEAVLATFSDHVLDKELNAVVVKLNGNVAEVELIDPTNGDFNINQNLASVLDDLSSPSAQTEGEENQAMPEAIPPLVVSCNEKVDVFVSHLNSPTSFYVQFVSLENDIANFADKITAEYDSLGPKERCLQNYRSGALCCARFSEDGAWYRAKITSTDGEKVGVCFLDYGNVDTVTRSEVKQLEGDYVLQPTYAIHCTLSGIESPEQGWTGDDIAKFEEITEAGDVLLKAKFVNNSDEKREIVLWKEDVLVSTLFGEQAKESASQSNVEENKEEETASQSNVEENKEEETASQSIAEENKEEESATASKQEGKQVNEQQPGQYPPQIKLEGKVKVYICHVETPEKFYVQLESQEEEIHTISASLEDGGSLENITDSLVAGDVCAGQSSADATWYRALVVAVEGTAATVSFVDYGNHEELDTSCLRKLPQSLMENAPFAFECKLKLNNQDQTTWTDEDIEKFATLTQEHLMTADILSQNGNIFLVQLNNEGDDINEIFNSKNFEEGAHVSEGKEVNQKLEQEEDNADPPKEYPSVDIPKGPCDVYISHTDSPSCFYVQLASQEGSLEEITTALEKESFEEKVKSPKIGHPCIVKYSQDEAWYRAVVISIKENTAKVRFVDFGNSEEVPIDGLRTVPQNFLEKVPFALECKLKLNNQKQTPWTDEEIEQFSTLTQDSLLKADILEKTGDIIHVRLTKENVDINEIMDKNDVTDHPGASALQEEQSSNEEAEPFAEYPPLTIHKGQCRIYVSHVDSPSCFYIHLASEEEKLEEITAKLEKETFEERVKCPRVGQPCIVKYSQDEAWYRAVVTEVRENRAQVRFVDFGNSEEVDVTELRKIPEDFLADTPFSIQCKLNSVEEPEGGWSHEDVEKLRTLTEGENPLDAVILSGSRPYSINLNSCETNINQEFGVKDQDLEAKAEEGSESTETQVLAFPKVVLPNEEVECIVSSVFSPSLFFIQLNSDEQAMNTWQDRLQLAYSIVDHNPHMIEMKEGNVCCAKFAEDELWYRGEIKSISDEGITVLFVDYGNSEIVKKEDIKRLSEEFCEYPPYAIECQLEGGEKKEWTVEEIDLFVERTQAITMKAAFKERGSRPRIVLSDSEGSIDRIFEKQKENEITEASTKMSSTSEVQGMTETVNPNLIDNASTNITPATDQNTEDDSIDREEDRRRDEATSSEISESINESADTQKSLNEEDDLSIDNEEDTCQGLKTGQKVKVFISYLDSPSRFWSRRVTDDLKLENIKKEMQQRCEPDTPVTEPQVKKLYAAKYGTAETTAEWYRGEIESVDPNKPYANITFIDYGVTESVALADIRELPEDLASHKPMAFECLLYNVQSAAGHWTEEALKRFANLTMDVAITLEVVMVAVDEMDQIRNCYMVNLKSKGVSIGDTLKAEGLAIDGTTRVVRKDSPLESTRIEDASLLESKANIDFSDLSIMDSSSKYSYSKLPIKAKIKATVCHGESPYLFWVQPESNKKDLQLLEEKIEEYCEAQTIDPSALNNLGRGDPCLVKSVEFEKWYRASILSKEGNDVEVAYVDYGNQELVTLEQILPINASFMCLPAMGVQCSLAKIRPSKNHDEWSQEGIDYFLEQVLEKEFVVECEFKDKSDTYRVLLLDMGISVAQKLVDQGFAEFASSLHFDDDEDDMMDQYRVGGIDNFAFEGPDIPIGSTVGLTYVEGGIPSSFMCQLTESSPVLVSMMESIADHCSSPLTAAKVQSLKIGQPCLVQNPKDKGWYRGCVVGFLKDPDMVEVDMVDFGYTKIVERDNIQKLNVAFRDLPAQAITCCLAGVNIDGADEIACRELLDSLCINQELTGKIVDRRGDGCFELELYTDSLLNGQSINQQLINMGLATIDERADFSTASNILEKGFLEGSQVMADSLNNGEGDSSIQQEKGATESGLEGISQLEENLNGKDLELENGVDEGVESGPTD